MNRMLRSVALLLSAATLVGVASGCTVQKANATGSSGGTSADGGVTAAAPGLSCLQIVQCIADCPDTDAACPDACANKGTSEGKANILAFGNCIETEKCTESTCIQEKCAESLNACVSSSSPKGTGTARAGDAPPGSVPADLAGTWAGARDGITQRLVLGADGSGSWMTGIVSKQSACFSYNRVLRTGNVVVADKKITIYATSVVESIQECAPPSRDTDHGPQTEELRWSRPSDTSDTNTILMVDSECAAKYPGTEDCNMAGCPIGLYCTSRLTRE
jgi:hypothetical protein